MRTSEDSTVTSVGSSELIKSASEVISNGDCEIKDEVVLREKAANSSLNRKPRVKSYLMGWAQVVEELSWKLRNVSSMW
jgi:hypothetical protein